MPKKKRKPGTGPTAELLAQIREAVNERDYRYYARVGDAWMEIRNIKNKGGIQAGVFINGEFQWVKVTEIEERERRPEPFPYGED